MGILLTFQQAYQPVGDSLLLSAVVAGLPLYVLFVMLAVLRLPAWICAITAMLTAFVLGWLVWGMPFGVSVGTATEGMAFGLWPISWIVLNAVFFHNLTVASGDFDVIKRSLTRLTTDRRQLTLFSILIPAYLIVVLAGFRRMTEILPAVLVTGVSFAIVQFLVSNFVGPELTDIIAALVSMGCLALLLRVWRPKNTWEFAAESAAATSAPAPRPVMGGSDLPARGVADTPDTRTPRDVIDSPGRITRAYAMYLVLVIVILIGQMGNLPWWSGHPVGDVKTALGTPANVTADRKCGTPAFALCKQPWIGPDPAKDRQAFKFPDWNFLWPGTYEIQKGQPVSLISREKPIVSKSTAYPLAFDWNFLAAAGSLVLYACIVAFLLMLLAGARLNFFAVYARTIRQLALPIATIALILAIAQLMNYSGMTASMAIALSKTGFIFPFVAAFLGWLGVFLTGSDTSSNTLFGPLQAQTAQQLGNVSPILTAGTNSSGGVMGKMISPQNLSVGAAGVNKVGAEGDIFRRVIGYSLILTSAVGVVAMIEAYVIPGIVPTP